MKASTTASKDKWIYYYTHQRSNYKDLLNFINRQKALIFPKFGFFGACVSAQMINAPQMSK